MKPYRGIDKDNKRWVYGWLYKDGKCYIVTNNPLPTSEYSFLAGKFFVSFIKVLQKTVSQSIGFTDKNNKEMYFDDIVVWNKRKYVVVWNTTCLGVYLEHLDSYLARQKDPKGKKFIETLLVGRAKYCEVIGTIHDEKLK